MIEYIKQFVSSNPILTTFVTLGINIINYLQEIEPILQLLTLLFSLLILVFTAGVKLLDFVEKLKNRENVQLEREIKEKQLRDKLDETSFKK